MKKKSFILFILIGFLSLSVWALPPGGAGGDPDNDVPIDGGISLLIAAGAAIGGSKYLKKKKETEV